jgi:hypothetical protein
LLFVVGRDRRGRKKQLCIPIMCILLSLYLASLLSILTIQWEAKMGGWEDLPSNYVPMNEEMGMCTQGEKEGDMHVHKRRKGLRWKDELSL